MIETEQHGNILVARATGRITADDYESVLIPAIEAITDRGVKARFLYELGEGFTGYSAAAMWDDARVGLAHLHDFEKIAVVTDEGWVRVAVRLFGFAMPCPVGVYSLSERDAARAWIAA